MAPALNLEVDMNAFSEADLLQSYWKLFPHMAKDFLTIIDFSAMMGQATAPPPAYKVVFAPTSAGASSLTAAYKTGVETGAAVRGGIVTGLETVTAQ